MAAIDIPTTYGAILIGASVAFGLSGIVGLQSVIYFKVYSEDKAPIKALVCAVWALDWTHSAFLCTSLVEYFITFFGVPEHIDHLPWSIAFTVVVTAIQTFLAHCFFAQKILRSSNNNWYITGPILVLAMLRLLAASVSTVEMVRLQKYSAFTLKYPGWIFTSGLSLSAGTDVIITGWLYYFLREMRGRMGSTIMIKLIDTLTLYTLETGALTSLATIASLVCWLTMPRNLVFLGLHFVIGKLYANSLLASLNTRKELRRMRTRHPGHRPWGLPMLSTDYPRQHSTFTTSDSHGLPDPTEVYMSPTKVQKLQINVEQTVERDAGLGAQIDHAFKRFSRRFSAWDRPTV